MLLPRSQQRSPDSKIDALEEAAARGPGSSQPGRAKGRGAHGLRFNLNVGRYIFHVVTSAKCALLVVWLRPY